MSTKNYFDIHLSRSLLSLLLRIFLLLLISISLSSCFIFYTTEKTYVYQVKPGDTLASIAANFQMDFRKLARYNRINNPNQIFVGQVLEIPLSGSSGSAQGASDQIQFAKPSHFLRGRGKANHGLLSWPIRSSEARISSEYGWRWTKLHEGLDIAAPTGTSIYAAHSGRVVMSGYQISGYGKMLIIQKGEMLTVYGHNDENHVDVGQNVSVGQKIAEVGSTGKTTGPHVHFELRFRNKGGRFESVDPKLYLP